MTEYQTINWNGQTLEISTEPNQTFSRITGEEYSHAAMSGGSAVRTGKRAMVRAGAQRLHGRPLSALRAWS